MSDVLVIHKGESVGKSEERLDWYRIRNAADPIEAEVSIYDEISPFGTGAKEFRAALNAITAPRISLRINSPGGHVFEAFAIYNALREHPAHVTTHIDGWAASAASVVAMAGDEIRIASNGFLMIHDPQGVALGDARTMRSTADVLDKLGGKIADIYAARSKQAPQVMRDAMLAETWYTAEDAKSAGLVDNVVGESKNAPAKIAACAKFARPPAALKSQLENAMPCKMPDGTMDEEKDQAACEAAGGEWGAPEAPEEKSATAKRKPAAKAATIAQAKSAAPSAPAESVLAWVEAGLTEGEIVARDRERLATDNAKLRTDLDAAKKAAPATAGQAVPVVASADVSIDSADAIKAEWESDADLRREFGGQYENYSAWRRASAEGRVKIN